MTDQSAHTAAFKAAVGTLAAPQNVYTYAEFKQLATKPADYVLVDVSRRFGGEQRVCGNKATTGWRGVARSCGRTDVNVRTLHGKVSGVEMTALTVAAEPTTRLQFETEDPVAEDDIGWSGATTWTWTF